ncbi:calcium-activated chloride channel regulator 1-like [Dendropsophus ebraccatus]|uniref:calcium-activated chloride channel regulator 1-like n=1 Tax=Dendropsophus ebraccatus TaxID=150705 RepID=UPI0038320151
MSLRIVFLLLLIPQFLYTSNGSLVQVNNGGYEDIVFAIGPDVKEDIRIIEKIQEMVKEASDYLFEATEKRLFIRSVKILIPSTWTPGNNYTKPTAETFNTADIIITHPYVKYGDDPYTLQYGRCGEPGRYIHLTPNYLLDDNIAVYGPKGRVFIHEWAHLRWGVYDEYSEENPYYITQDRKVEATRCPSDIFGINIIKTSECHGENCPTRACNFDSASVVYEEGCLFLPDLPPFDQVSLMYSQGLSSLATFCDSSTHNADAPNLQNKMCNYRSTWDVIKESTDITSSPPVSGSTIPAPTFTLLQSRGRAVTLVLDVSGSMVENDRMTRLHRAVDMFLTQIIQPSVHVGIIQFSGTASVISSLQRINDQQREKLKSLRASTATEERANVCSGIISGLEVNKHLDGSAQGTEIVLLTGEDDAYNARTCIPDIISSGAVIHVITLGTRAGEELENITAMTGGQLVALGNKDVDINVLSTILPIDGQETIQLESSALDLPPKTCLNGSFFMDDTIGNGTVFLVTWQTSPPSIHLQDPKGISYTETQFTHDPASKSSQLHLPGTAERGRWDYGLCNHLTSSEVMGVTVTSKAADENVPPIMASCHMNKDTNDYPNPMVIYASVSQGLMPVSGAKVTAIIESESGDSVITELLDTGAGADVAKNDGIYSRYFTSFTTNGKYSLKVRVIGKDNKSRLTLPRNRAHYLPGYSIRGKVTFNPPRPKVSDDDLQLQVGDFSRTASGGSFVVSNVPSGVQPDIYRPEKISDLEARLEEYRTVLSWTATGDDLDIGQASKYELRMNTDPKGIRDHFESSSVVNTAGLMPRPAGVKETFIFALENTTIANGTILYYAIVAIDKEGQKSDRSNIVHCLFYNVPLPPTTTPVPTTTHTDTTRPRTTTTAHTRPLTTTDSSSLTTSIPIIDSNGNVDPLAITIIVCSSAVLICLIVCILVCLNHR